MQHPCIIAAIIASACRVALAAVVPRFMAFNFQSAERPLPAPSPTKTSCCRELETVRCIEADEKGEASIIYIYGRKTPPLPYRHHYIPLGDNGSDYFGTGSFRCRNAQQFVLCGSYGVLRGNRSDATRNGRFRTNLLARHYILSRGRWYFNCCRGGVKATESVNCVCRFPYFFFFFS